MIPQSESGDLLTVDLIVAALTWEAAKRKRAGRVYCYHVLTVCERCLRDYIIDYMGLVLTTRGIRCDLCGKQLVYPHFEALFCTATRPRLDDAWLKNQRKLGLGGRA